MSQGEDAGEGSQAWTSRKGKTKEVLDGGAVRTLEGVERPELGVTEAGPEEQRMSREQENCHLRGTDHTPTLIYIPLPKSSS